MVNFLLILWDVDQVREAQGFGTSRNMTRHFFVCVPVHARRFEAAEKLFSGSRFSSVFTNQ